MSHSIPNARIVPTGNWVSHAGKRIYIGVHRTRNRFKDWVAHTTVKLRA